jgi:hypothetical protein
MPAHHDFAWCFPDERDICSRSVLNAVASREAIVPDLWLSKSLAAWLEGSFVSGPIRARERAGDQRELMIPAVLALGQFVGDDRLRPVGDPGAPPPLSGLLVERRYSARSGLFSESLVNLARIRNVRGGIIGMTVKGEKSVPRNSRNLLASRES